MNIPAGLMPRTAIVALLMFASACTDPYELALQQSEQARSWFFDQASAEVKLARFLDGEVDGVCLVDYTASPDSLPVVNGTRLTEADVRIPPGDQYFLLLVHGRSRWSQTMFRANEVGFSNALGARMRTDAYCFRANVLYTNVAPRSRGSTGAAIHIEGWAYVE